jgi:hypothetical protein
VEIFTFLSDRNHPNEGIDKPITRLESKGQKWGSSLYSFFLCAKGLYAAALGIEILCIIGENTGLYLIGFNPAGLSSHMPWDMH